MASPRSASGSQGHRVARGRPLRDRPERIEYMSSSEIGFLTRREEGSTSAGEGRPVRPRRASSSTSPHDAAGQAVPDRDDLGRGLAKLSPDPRGFRSTAGRDRASRRSFSQWWLTRSRHAAWPGTTPGRPPRRAWRYRPIRAANVRTPRLGRDGRSGQEKVGDRAPEPSATSRLVTSSVMASRITNSSRVSERDQGGSGAERDIRRRQALDLVPTPGATSPRGEDGHPGRRGSCAVVDHGGDLGRHDPLAPVGELERWARS